MGKTIVITGAGSGFGALAARAPADAGHTVYAAEHEVDLRTVELDVLSQESADAAVATILAGAGALDVVVHNAGHLATGPAEAFTPGSEEVSRVADRIRAEFLTRIGLDDLLAPRPSPASARSSASPPSSASSRPAV
ncbi:SDR family NAD(P)-dependent oxidoreductase [Streptomyces sp. NPDC087844]|uniref:SDR family NAD(P)-dependent oxidoreductase n=1 Tax=Streptomyces sp. NPDC087844 TaxID=3365805 RepID=UPI0037FA6E3E